MDSSDEATGGLSNWRLELRTRTSGQKRRLELAT